MAENEYIKTLRKLSDDDLILQAPMGTDRAIRHPLELNRRLKDSINILNQNVLELNQNVSILNKATSRYSKIIIWLTVSIGILTAVSAYFAYKAISM
jgi:hypothetical protein